MNFWPKYIISSFVPIKRNQKLATLFMTRTTVIRS